MKKYLFDCLREISNKTRNTDYILLCLDYDGTLVPICKNPSLAKLSLETKELLTDLSQNPCISMNIISGRPLNEIKKLIGIENILYAGNHGFEISNKQHHWVYTEEKKIKPLLKNDVKGAQISPIFNFGVCQG